MIYIIYNLFNADLIDSHKILSICTRFMAEAFPSFVSQFYKLLTEASANDSDLEASHRVCSKIG